jgi:hypothetical protein
MIEQKNSKVERKEKYIQRLRTELEQIYIQLKKDFSQKQLDDLGILQFSLAEAQDERDLDPSPENQAKVKDVVSKIQKIDKTLLFLDAKARSLELQIRKKIAE